MASRPRPTNNESPFEIHELFFSRTDLKGIMRSANRVFTRVSDYAKSEMMGKAHNMIRHPDMPRTIFRLFWSDYLEKGLPIGSYIKNISKTGSYYWVYAFAFPLEGGYVSIRLKPSSPVFEKIQEIYKKVLAAEKSTGGDKNSEIEAGRKVLDTALRDLGYQNYDAFMVEALTQEFLSRDHLLDTMSSDSAAAEKGHGHPRALNDSRELVLAYKKIFHGLERSKKYQETIISRCRDIHEIYRDLQLFTINMSIISKSCGARARSLTSVSDGFYQTAMDISERLEYVNTRMGSLKAAFSDAKVYSGFARLQSEMIEEFLVENYRDGIVELSLDEQESLSLIVNLASDYTAKVESSTLEIVRILKAFQDQLSEVGSIINALSLVHLAGKMEAARVSTEDESVNSSLNSYIEEMKGFVDQIRPSLAELLGSMALYEEESKMIADLNKQTDQDLIQIRTASKKLVRVRSENSRPSEDEVTDAITDTAENFEKAV